MSLDITVISPEPIFRKSTGIYARVDGTTKELTPEEACIRFPDVYRIPEDVPVEMIEDNDLWWGNITHNLGEMASHCRSLDGQYSLKALLWRDEFPTNEAFKTDDVHTKYVSLLTECLQSLKRSPEYFRQYNPANGWGDYELLVSFLTAFIKALIDAPHNYKVQYSK